MSDLNLDFDQETKSISLSNVLNDNLNINKDNDNNFFNDNKSGGSFTEPKLNVSSDLSGVELLAKGVTNNNVENESKSEEKDESSFSFFKKVEDTVGDTVPEQSNVEDEILIGESRNSDMGGDYRPIHKLSPQEIKNEKIDLLYKFKKLEHQGIRTTMNYNMNSHLDDMRNEYIKLKKQREIDNSIKFQRKVMMAAITGLEFLNNKFDPLSIHLDGWSESVSENIYDYDEVFEELYEKYGGTTEVAPEIKLLMLLGGSAFMFHLTNTMFKTSMPGMGDIMKDNPELMKQFASAAMGNVMGSQPNQQPNQKPQMQQDMVGPDNIDEIINDMNLQPNNIDLDQISIMSDLSNGLTMDLS